MIEADSSKLMSALGFGESLGNLLQRRAAERADHVALVGVDGQEVTYGDLHRFVRKATGRLPQGADTVAVVMPHQLELGLTILSLASVRTCLPLPPNLKKSEYEKILKESGVKVLVAPKDQSEAVSAARELDLSVLPSLEPSDGSANIASDTSAALLMQTSGTTGSAKRITLTHRNLLYSAARMTDVLNLSSEDRCLAILPFYHIHGFSTLLASLVSGSTVICPGEFNSADYLKALELHQATWYSASPTIHRLALEAWIANGSPRHSLRFLRSASAPMPSPLRVQVESSLGVPLLEAYGKTETAPQISCQSLSHRKLGSVGQPQGVEVVIINQAGTILPSEQTGEIVVRGENVSPDCGTWHRTGDLGYLDAHGHLYIVGRKKDMINRGGVKLAPGEIESAILEHPDVVEAAAFALPHEVLGESVGLAVVTKRAVSETEIRGFLEKRLAAFKLPERVYRLDTIPKGPSHKIQRGALARRLQEIATPSELSLEDDVTRRIRLVWSEILGVEAPGANSNFFTLGGHSLAAARVITRYRERYGWRMSLDEFFLHPEVESQALLFRERGGDLVEPRAQRSLSEGTSFPLTSPQRRLWFLQKRFPQSSAYNMSCLLEIQGNLDIKKLEQALQSVVQRHSPLRAAFEVEESLPRQRPVKPAPFFLPYFNLQERGDQDRRSLLATQSARPFVLEAGELFRAALFSLGPDSHELFLTVHHIIFDGWSWSILLRDLKKYYEGEIAYEERAFFLRAEETEERCHRKSLAFWKNELDGIPPVLALPTEQPDGPVNSSAPCGEVSFSLEGETAENLRRLNPRSYEVLLGGLAVLLSRLTNQQEFAVGTPTANRTDSEAEELVGLFANTLPLPIRIGSGKTFLELVRSLERTVSRALEHQNVPLDRLLDEMDLERDATRNPLFQVMFAYQNFPFDIPKELSPGLKWKRLKLEGQEAKFPLALYLTPEENGWSGCWRYDRKLLAAETVQAWSKYFLKLLELFAARPDVPLDTLKIFTPQPFLAGPPRPQPQLNVLQRIEQFVLETPSAGAVEWDGESWSYQALWAQVEKLACGLVAEGVRPGNVVAVCGPRGPSTLAVFLAVWRAGATLVPLDPAYPDLRRDSCLSQSSATHLVGEFPAGSNFSGSVISFQQLSAQNSSADLPPLSNLKDTAYIIFTSGSTGQPKGVAINHSNLTHYWDALGERLGIEASDRWLHTASFAFSSSFRQFVLPLTHGATVVVAGPRELADPACLLQTVVERKLTILDLVPTHWKACLRVSQALTEHNLRLLLSASEPLGRKVASHLLKQFRGATLVNMYGQTETTGIVATEQYESAPYYRGTVVPLGKPLARTVLHLLDEAGNPVPSGAVGRLAITGPGVGRYLNQAQPPPNHHTGDLARLGAGGSLQYRGRLDSQLKVRGFRVEPSEVESVLLLHPLVDDAVIVKHNTGLKAFLKVSGPLTLAEVRSHSARSLPPYMVVSAMEVVGEFPTSPTGKTDRRSLRASDPDALEDRLLSIWRRVLDEPKVMPEDNFFELGGNSILSVEIVTSAQESGIPLTLEILFQRQSIAEICHTLSGGDRALPEEKIRVSPEDALRWGVAVLRESGLNEEVARVVAEVQLESSMRGQKTHNLVDIPRYAKRVREGILNPSPRLSTLRDDDLFVLLDADNGPGQWAATRAMELAVDKAAKNGLGIASVRCSNHFGAAGHYPLLAASRGMIGFATTNGPLILAPTGGVTPTFGNNPMAFAIPAGKNSPVMLDIALSVAPRGRIGHFVARGKPLPEGWILNAEGLPTTNLADLAAGLGVPIGGHKGYGLAFVMEVLAGVLSGAGFGLKHAPGNHPIDLGHFFLALDPARLADSRQFKEAVDRLISQTKSSRRALGTDKIYYPGEREWNTREESARAGVEVPRGLAQEILHKGATS